MTERQFTPIHHLAYVYLFFAHYTDFKLTDEEIKMIFERVYSWSDGADLEEVKETFTETVHFYEEDFKNRSAQSHLSESLDALDHVVTLASRCELIDDLVAIAEADGKWDPNEVVLLEGLAERWGAQVCFEKKK